MSSVTNKLLGWRNDQIGTGRKIVKATPHLYERDAARIVNAMLQVITEALSRGDRVELRGFGAFSLKHLPARIHRNPRTGKRIPVSERVLPRFKVGTEMRNRLMKDPASS